jgi:hypothetical protein
VGGIAKLQVAQHFVLDHMDLARLPVKLAGGQCVLAAGRELGVVDARIAAHRASIAWPWCADRGAKRGDPGAKRLRHLRRYYTDMRAELYRD